MRKYLSTIVAAGVLAVAASAAAPAFAEDFNDGSFAITANGGYGLEIETWSYNGGNLPNFSLDVGDAPLTFSLFNIWTDETTLNWGEDNVAQPFNVNFTFSSPTLNNGSAEGETNGYYVLGGLFQEGRLIWDNGGVFNFGFGNGGNLQLTLNNADFNTGFLSLNEGWKKGDIVKGTFELTAASVPEPATWAMMITGFGLAGVAIRRRRTLGAIAA